MDILTISFHLLIFHFRFLFVWSTKETYDYIIIGGGTAGCVLANRLSENPEISVLLLEAGPDPKYNRLVSTPRTFFDVYTDQEYDWGYVTESQPFMGSKKGLHIHQGKVLGGCGSHNAMVYTRCSPHDYDRWAELGNTGWAYKDVLPYFLKSEHMHIDPEYEKYIERDFHGFDGEMQVKVSDVSALENDIIKGGIELGFNDTDPNGENFENSIGPAQITVDENGQRSSTLEAFLRPVMSRRNLVVVTEAFVTKINIIKTKSSPKADGVFYVKDNVTHYVAVNNEVIVSGGTFNSPKILQLSGVGPKHHLQDMNIEVIADLPVGNNLQNHNAAQIPLQTPFTAKSKIEQLFSAEALFEYVFTGRGPWSKPLEAVLSFSRSKIQPENDLYPYIEHLFVDNFLTLINHSELLKAIKEKSKISSKIFADLLKSNDILSPLVVTPTSLHPKVRGTVRLRSNNPLDKPVINLPYLEHELDITDIVEGIRLLQRFLNTSSFINAGIHLQPNSDPNCNTFTFDTDDYWKCYVKHNFHLHFHYTSTCKMAPDATGVVDDQLRVKGINGLRVVDASIMPEIVSGHTNAPTVMIAEKASDMIKQEYKASNKNVHSPSCISKATTVLSSAVTFIYFAITIFVLITDTITVN